MSTPMRLLATLLLAALGATLPTACDDSTARSSAHTAVRGPIRYEAQVTNPDFRLLHATPTELLAAGTDGAIWRSDDGGLHWAETPTPSTATKYTAPSTPATNAKAAVRLRIRSMSNNL